jgi:hypothetical protein
MKIRNLVGLFLLLPILGLIGCGKVILTPPAPLAAGAIVATELKQQQLVFYHSKTSIGNSISLSILESLYKFSFTNKLSYRDIDIQIRASDSPKTDVHLLSGNTIETNFKLPVAILLTLSKGFFSDKKEIEGFLTIQVISQFTPNLQFSEFRSATSYVSLIADKYIGPYSIDYNVVVNSPAFKASISESLSLVLNNRLNIKKDIVRWSNNPIKANRLESIVIVRPKSFSIHEFKEDSVSIISNVVIQSNFLFAKGFKNLSLAPTYPIASDSSSANKAYPFFARETVEKIENTILDKLQLLRCCGNTKINVNKVKIVPYDTLLGIQIGISSKKLEGEILLYGELIETSGVLKFNLLELSPHSNISPTVLNKFPIDQFLSSLLSAISFKVNIESSDESLNEKANVKIQFEEASRQANEVRVFFEKEFCEFVIYKSGQLKIELYEE